MGRECCRADTGALSIRVHSVPAGSRPGPPARASRPGAPLQGPEARPDGTPALDSTDTAALCSNVTSAPRRVAALPASACDRKRSIRVSAVMITLVRGWLSLLPVPGSCRVLRAGGRVKGRAALACGAAGVLDATARERIMPGGRQGALVVVVVKRFSWWPFWMGDQRDGRRREPGAASLT